MCGEHCAAATLQAPVQKWNRALQVEAVAKKCLQMCVCVCVSKKVSEWVNVCV